VVGDVCRSRTPFGKVEISAVAAVRSLEREDDGRSRLWCLARGKERVECRPLDG
jgi:hypothetical protein